MVGPTPATGLAALGLSDSAFHAFAAALQGVLLAGVSAAVPSPSLYTPTGKVAPLTLLHIHFVCGVAVDGYPPNIWEAVTQGKGSMEGISTLNRDLMWGLPYCFWVFGGRGHFSASLPLIVFVKNVILLNPSLDPDCTWGGSHPG